MGTDDLYQQIDSLPAASGIYRIWNERTGDSYIGASKNVRLRCFQHFSRLSNGQATKALTDAFKPGGGSAAIEVLKLCGPESLDREEKRFIRELKPSLNGAHVPERAIIKGDYITIADAARIKGCTRQAVHAAVKRGDLLAAPQIVQTKIWTVDKKSLAKWAPNPRSVKNAGRPRREAR
jgi:hypothetical protein